MSTLQRAHYRAAFLLAAHTIAWWIVTRRPENSAAAATFSRLAALTVLVVPLGVSAATSMNSRLGLSRALWTITLPGLAILSWILAWDTEERVETPIHAVDYAVVQSAFLLFVIGLAVFESAVFACRSRCLLTMVAATLLLWSPFMLDAVVVHDDWSPRRFAVAKLVLGHSPIALTGACVDRFDLYKQAHVYARYRIAEELVPPPAPRAGSIHLGITGILLGVSGLWISRRRRSEVERCEGEETS